MNTRSGNAGGAGASRRGRVWLLLPAGLLALNLAIVAVTVTMAAGDRSVATEPDYYRKAMNFDEQARAREASRRLGWKAAAEVGGIGGGGGGGREVVVRLTDREGGPIAGAEVEVVMFAHVRSGDRRTVRLTERRERPGEYAGVAEVDRTGLWRVGVGASRGTDRFTEELEVRIPG